MKTKRINLPGQEALWTALNMRKRHIMTILLIITSLIIRADDGVVVSSTEGSITFTVDGDLPPVSGYYRFLRDGERIAKFMLAEEQIPSAVQRIIASSFADENSLRPMGKDAFYRCLVDAYANHLSITLSPDMIWLVISQGFARYVNAHAEELRSHLVEHTGKMDLAINADEDLLSENVDWPKLIDGFSSQISKYTKKDIAQTITSDFTTTGPVERMASQITLMESVKSYFEYIVYRASCGIPTVTLKGTAGDWQRVLDKTRNLKQYGLAQWVDELEPLLEQFIQAASGHPNQSFWKGMVKKQIVDQLKGGACSPELPTVLDGWMLRLFPDENGKTLDKVGSTKEMPAEYVRVNFNYCLVNPGDGAIVSKTPMELWAGFVGAEVDTLNCMLTPKIGWLVRVAEDDEDTLNELKKNNNDWGIHLRVQEVPEVMSRLGHIKKLVLVFTGKAVLPDWMDKLTIDDFTIDGEMSEEEMNAIKKRFPGSNITRRIR